LITPNVINLQFVLDTNDNFVIVRIFIFEIDNDITIRMVEVLKIDENLKT